VKIQLPGEDKDRAEDEDNDKNKVMKRVCRLCM
jgi:hypothetical protein